MRMSVPTPFGLSEVEASLRAKRECFASSQHGPSTSLRANGNFGLETVA